MEAVPKRRATKEDWSRHKEEIGHLYLVERKTLQEVMQFMSEQRQFPHATVNMWKQHIRRWGFDAKNNKLSTVAAAIPHFEDRPDEKTEIVYRPPGSKPLSKSEIQRYLRRKKMQIFKGEVVPKDSLRSSPVGIRQNTELTPTNNHSGTRQESQLAESVDQWLGLHRFDPRRHREHADPPISKRLIQSRQRYGAGLIIDNSRNNKHINPADLTLNAPDMYHSPEKFLNSLQTCMESSWVAGLWVASERSFFKHTQQRAFGIDCFDFPELIRQAYELRTGAALHQSRKMFHNALAALRVGLQVCPPFAIERLLSALSHLIDLGRLEYAKRVTEWAWKLLGTCRDLQPEVRHLLAVLPTIDIDGLRAITASGWIVWGDSMRRIDARLEDQYIMGRARSIVHGPQSSGGSKIDELSSLLEETRYSSQASVWAELACMTVLASAHYAQGNLKETRTVVVKGLQMVETHRASTGEYFGLMTADFNRLLALVQWKAKDTYNARQNIKLSVMLQLEYGCLDVSEDIRLLASWEAQLKNEREAQAHHQLHEEMSIKLASISFDEGNASPTGWTCSGSSGSVVHPIKDCPERPLYGEIVELEYEIIGPRDQPENFTRTESRQVAWQETVAADRRQDLTLPIPDEGIDEIPG